MGHRILVWPLLALLVYESGCEQRVSDEGPHSATSNQVQGLPHWSNTTLSATNQRLYYTRRPASAVVSLVLSLLQYSQHRDVLILHDHSTIDLNTLLEGNFARWTDTTLFHLPLHPGQLGVVLKAPKTTGLRLVVVLGSNNDTRRIFDMVSAGNLESGKVRWMVVGEEPGLGLTLPRVLREGTLVTLAERVSNGRYQILVSYVDQHSQVRFGEAGWWVGGTEGTLTLRYPPFPDSRQQYRDFQGRHLIASALDNWPFFGLGRRGEGEKEVFGEKGLDISILNTLGDYLNFTYSVKEPEDGQWGAVLPDGTVTGMLGEVAHRRAHVAINEFTITNSRESVVDFTFPYFMDTTTITSKAPGERNRSLAVFYPFPSFLWLTLIIITLFMGPLGYLVSRRELSMTQNDNNIPSVKEVNIRGVEFFCFNMYRTVVIQGNFIPTRAWPLRILLFSWYAFCIIVFAVYSGTLTAYLTKPSYDKPIDTLEDLLAAGERGVVPSISIGTSALMVLKNAQSGIYKSIYNSLDPSRSFTSDGMAGVQRVLEKNTAHLTGRVGSEVYANLNGRNNYHLARDSFMPQQYGIACHMGSPYIPIFNIMLGGMIEAGLVNKWFRDEMDTMRRGQDQQMTSVVGAGSEVEQGGGGSGVVVRALKLDHLQGAFYILMGGAGGAAAVLVMETLAQYIKR